MRIEIESVNELKELIAMFSAPLPTGAEQAAAEVLRKTEAKLAGKKAVEDAIAKDKLRKMIHKMGVMA